MKESQKIDLRLSEQRDKLTIALRACEDAGDGVTAEQRAAVRSIQDTMTELNSQWREAIKAEAEAEETARQNAPAAGEARYPAEVRELRAIEERASVQLCIRQALGDAPREGAEKELREAFDLGDQFVPWNAFVPRPSEREEETGEAQERADATVNAPATIQAYQNRIIGRVFSGSALMFLGVRPRTVGVGDQIHLTITAGGTAKYVARGAGQDYPQATLTPKTTTPKRLTLGYRIAKVDTLRVSGVESALRNDLSMSMADRFDHAVLNNQAADGLSGSFLGAGGLGAPGRSPNGAAADSLDAVLAELTQALDGKHARGEQQIRTVVNPAVGGWLAAHFRGDSTMTGLGFLRQQLGGVYISANMPGEINIGGGSTAHDHDVLQALTGPGMPNNCALDIWQGVMVTRDTLTRAKQGDIIIVMDSFADFVLTRLNGAGFSRRNVTI